METEEEEAERRELIKVSQLTDGTAQTQDMAFCVLLAQVAGGKAMDYYRNESLLNVHKLYAIHSAQKEAEKEWHEMRSNKQRM